MTALEGFQDDPRGVVPRRAVRKGIAQRAKQRTKFGGFGVGERVARANWLGAHLEA